MLDRLHVYDTSTLDEVIADESTGEGLDANTGVTLFESVFGVSSICLGGTGRTRGGPTTPDRGTSRSTSSTRGPAERLCALSLA